MHEPQWDISRNKHSSLLPALHHTLSLLSSISAVTSCYKKQNAFIQCLIISGFLITELLIAFISGCGQAKGGWEFPLHKCFWFLCEFECQCLKLWWTAEVCRVDQTQINIARAHMNQSVRKHYPAHWRTALSAALQ